MHEQPILTLNRNPSTTNCLRTPPKIKNILSSKGNIGIILFEFWVLLKQLVECQPSVVQGSDECTLWLPIFVNFHLPPGCG